MGRRVVFSLFVFLAACQKPPEGPVEAYLAFHQAIAGKEWNRAVLYLTPETRQAFRSVGRNMSETVGYDGDHLGFFLRGISARVAPLAGQPEIVEQTDERARVAVGALRCPPEKGDRCEKSEGVIEKSEVVLERHEGRWLIAVELPAELKPAAGATQGGG